MSCEPHSATPSVVLLLLGLALGGCAEDTTAGRDEVPVNVSVEIDETVQPVLESLEAFEDGAPRPLAAVADEDGSVSCFVANELLVSGGPDGIDDFVQRYEGEILLSIDPATEGVPDLPPMALVRVKTEAVDDSGLAADLRDVAQNKGLLGTGQLRISSHDGARLLAAAYAELREGLEVSVNYVAEPVAIPGSTEECPLDGGVYENAYQWGYWKAGTALNHGVPEAWSLLYHTNTLNNRVKIAVIDGGFCPDEDFRPHIASAVGGGVVNRSNHMSCGGNPCPWHGNSVASAAMAIPDNQYGAAGTGGPVGVPIFIYVRGDMVTATFGVLRAQSKGAKIINLSFGGDVHWSLKPTTLHYRNTTEAVRDSGVLIFASAGNQGKDVDAEQCLEIWPHSCWEKRFFFPCENPGVICVGGLDENLYPNTSSNTGDENVDLWAPWCVYRGPNRGDEEDGVRPNKLDIACGTSFSSPFAAGIAALIWAASPSLSAGQVWNTMLQTANGSSHRPRPNAYAAVVKSMGTGFNANIRSPRDGATISAGIPTTLMAELNVVSSPGDYSVPVTVEWYSGLDGPLGTELVEIPLDDQDGFNTATSAWTGTLSAGTQVITLITRADVTPPSWSGQEIIVDQDMVVIQVTNPGPTAEIVVPADGSSFCPGENIAFLGQALDPNETLTDQAFHWWATRDDSPFFLRPLGEGPAIAVSDLGIGTNNVNLKVTDSGFNESVDTITVNILSAADPNCTDLPPFAQIDEPSNGAVFMTEGVDAQGEYKTITFRGTATDPEDDDATLLVEWSSGTDGKLGEGRVLTARVHMTETCTQQISITLRVTDSDGHATEYPIQIHLYYIC